jgi:hypothetical protein
MPCARLAEKRSALLIDISAIHVIVETPAS